MQALELGRLISVIEISFTKLTIVFSVFEHVIHGLCKLVGYRRDGAFGSSPGFEPMKLVFVVGSLLLYGCPGQFYEQSLEWMLAYDRLATVPLACGLIVAGA